MALDDVAAEPVAQLESALQVDLLATQATEQSPLQGFRGEIGGETAILYLLQARTDPDPDIRANASAILDELGEVTEY